MNAENKTLIMNTLKVKQNLQEKMANWLFGFFIASPFILFIIKQTIGSNPSIAMVLFVLMMTAGLAANILIYKYSSWKNQYDSELNKLGYFKTNQPAYYPHLSLGLYKKEGSFAQELFLTKHGVIAGYLN